MARKKNTFAQVARNIRRQADRKIARLKQMESEAKDTYLKHGARLRREALEEAKKGTYYRYTENGVSVKTTEESRREALQKSAQLLKSLQHVSAAGRRNLASTQTQLNAASVGAASMYTQEQVRIFYRATQAAWQRPGVKLQDRNQAILEYYGYENLSQLVSDVLTMNVAAEEAARKTKAMEKLTAEQEEYVTESDVREAQSSPTYLQEVVSMPEPSGLYAPEEEYEPEPDETD